MLTPRPLMITCPTCGHRGRYTLQPAEDTPLLAILHCDTTEGGCDTPFAVEVRLRVEVTVNTCRLALPSTTRPDALVEVQTLPEPEDEIPF